MHDVHTCTHDTHARTHACTHARTTRTLQMHALHARTHARTHDRTSTHARTHARTTHTRARQHARQHDTHETTTRTHARTLGTHARTLGTHARHTRTTSTCTHDTHARYARTHARTTHTHERTLRTNPSQVRWLEVRATVQTHARTCARQRNYRPFLISYNLWILILICIRGRTNDPDPPPRTTFSKLQGSFGPASICIAIFPKLQIAARFCERCYNCSEYLSWLISSLD
jgi:hypothetical protein